MQRWKLFWASFNQSFEILICNLKNWVENKKKYVDLWKKIFILTLFSIEIRGKRYFSTMLKVCFNRARPCSRYVSTVLEICSGRTPDMLRPCSTVLEICFDRARDMFRPCSRYVSTVLEVIFDHARGMLRISVWPKPLSRPFFSITLEVCFEFVFDRNPCRDHSFSLELWRVLDFESRNTKWAPRPGNWRVFCIHACRYLAFRQWTLQNSILMK